MPRYLLDTHILIWWFEGSPKLKPEIREIIQSGANAIYLSSGAIWEMAIKQSIGRLEFPSDLESLLQEDNIQVLPIAASHALAVATLPHHHRDPFDRIQIVQAQLDGLTLISRDEAFEQYDVQLITA